MERVSHTLQRLVTDALRRLPAEQLPEAAWEFAAGESLAARTRVLGLEGTVLVVEVRDPTWRAQLEAMTPQLLARLRQCSSMERIEYRLARPQDETRKSAKRKGNA